MRDIIPTFLNLYLICPRQLWLHANGVTMEHTSDLVLEGKLAHEHSYIQRSKKYKELDLGVAKIDHYDADNRVVHEIKKSNKKDKAHRAQVKYYLYLLEKMGVESPSAILEYPLLRETEKVELEEGDREQLRIWLREIEQVLSSGHCPPKLPKSKCRGCSYFDFCWSGE
ncbi:CRISPR-associated protein Cas4 (plasmid) [Fulvitalea axinellae]|uniref:CRISPR-associated exonuclease Cas4 n=1 Tax=Fulvitalea axinellae TaxID=1182444 RepID=A0AAU9CVC5_9BACT|nr:CRISPR-associated protein Cas4 [Fulvitalea axinellae]